MSKEILNKYIELIDKGYCDDCNELNCLGNFPHKDIAKNIKAILEENQELKQDIKNLVHIINHNCLELENPKEEIVVDRECIYLSDKPNYCYYVQTTGEYNWNKILKANKLTPKFVEETLNDNDKFLKLCELSNENGWNVIGKVVRYTYDYLLETRCGNLIVQLNDFSKDISTSILDIKNGNYYSTEEKAIEYRNNKIKGNIKYYLKYYADKFDDEK